GSIDLAAYMNLLAVHEMGHLYLDQATGEFDFHLPRRWLVELFCQLCLHAYTATQEAGHLLSLETESTMTSKEDDLLLEVVAMHSMVFQEP
ncbi:hypothetical protein DYH09_09560, partial [bacterium CPR1]|nr:hypothetical protein [bacterium CPR1]